MPQMKCDDCGTHFYPEDAGQNICETCIGKRLEKNTHNQIVRAMNGMKPTLDPRTEAQR